MERKIGEIFEHNGEWYQCVNRLSWGVHCNGCDFLGRICSKLSPKCSPAYYRSDGKSVIFKKLEKVGEQFLYKGKQMQSYIRATDKLVCNWNNNLLLLEHGGSNIIDIEVKQNKEDMEEKKLNLKPFDIQKAREGKPVCIRDGRKARIICFDKEGEQPIVALIENNGVESIETYYSNGRFNDDINSQSDGDLMMLPEKKVGWVNVYKSQMYDTLKSAEKSHNRITDYIKTIRVEWEE